MKLTRIVNQLYFNNNKKKITKLLYNRKHRKWFTVLKNLH